MSDTSARAVRSGVEEQAGIDPVIIKNDRCSADSWIEAWTFAPGFGTVPGRKGTDAGTTLPPRRLSGRATPQLDQYRLLRLLRRVLPSPAPVRRTRSR